VKGSELRRHILRQSLVPEPSLAAVAHQPFEVEQIDAEVVHVPHVGDVAVAWHVSDVRGIGHADEVGIIVRNGWKADIAGAMSGIACAPKQLRLDPSNRCAADPRMSLRVSARCHTFRKWLRVVQRKGRLGLERRS
jgi:hypothetical protein